MVERHRGLTGRSLERWRGESVRPLFGYLWGGALLQLPIDELVLTGDDVIILANFRPDLGVFQPLAGAGILFNKNGRIVPEESNHFGHSLARATPAEVLATMRRYIP